MSNRPSRDPAYRAEYAAAYNQGLRSLIPARSAQRRLQALARIGWTWPELAEVSGDPARAKQFSVIAEGKHDKVTRETHAVICGLYDVLQLCPASGPRSTWMRRKATAKGWASCLAWDDIDNDLKPQGVTRVWHG